MQLLDGLDEDTVDFVANYDGKEQEPVVLPARFPNLLVNGSQGIAVGMATNIPPHNLGEVIEAAKHLIDHPDATPEDLMQFVKGPDFPTGALILGRQGIIDAYTTGRGSIRLRARAEIEEGKNGTSIVVTDIPYQTSVEGIAEKAADLVNSRAIEGIREIRNERANRINRLVFELKRDATAHVVLNNLYKHTPLQTSFGVNMVALVDGVPRTLNLAQMLSAYVNHQVEVVTRRSEHRLAKAKARAHIAEGARQDRRHHQADPRVRRQGGGAYRADGQAVRVQRRAGRAHSRHDAEPPHPPRTQRARCGDDQVAGDDRRARVDPEQP
jgi:DNA gyrase subunit A